jgi:ABC-type transporter Mla subunit MlaD
MPRIPGLSELVDVLQKQTEAMAQLPRTMADLNGAVRELVAATRVATETIASAQRTAERLEDLVEELEEPVRALRPGLERVGKVLDDPAIDTVPDTLRTVADDLLPLVHGLRQATDRVGSVTGFLRRRAPGNEGRPENGAAG